VLSWRLNENPLTLGREYAGVKGAAAGAAAYLCARIPLRVRTAMSYALSRCGSYNGGNALTPALAGAVHVGPSEAEHL
jgi:hypothetical protein